MTIRPGLSATVRATVTDADTAAALGSGDLDVLGTPRAIALCEAATVECVRSVLASGTTTVGTSVDVQHRRPTALGGDVAATATLEEVDGATLVFAVVVEDGALGPDRPVMTGTVRRAVVETEPFLSRL